MSVIGLQLYSIKDELEKDFFGALEKVKLAGYDSVEFAGFYGHTAKELKSALADMGLTPLAAHTMLNDNATQTAQFAAELGLKFVVVPWAPHDTIEACHASNAMLKAAVPVFADVSITIGYHNHWSEFTRFNGRYALDIIMDGVDGIYEIDTGWAVKGGADLVAYIRGLGDKAGPIHAKDIHSDYATRNPENVNARIGDGVVDFRAVIEQLRLAGTLSRGIIVEQEAFSGPMFEILAHNARALRALADGRL